jgi:fluoride exporter
MSAADIKDMARSYGAVAAGSLIGSLARALVGIAFGALAFPWAVLFVNVTGSLVIGFYASLTEPGGRFFAGTHQRQFVMIGICGGYTTFSAFSLETLRLAQAGRWGSAGANVGLSLIGWLVAVWLGHTLAGRLNRLKGT